MSLTMLLVALAILLLVWGLHAPLQEAILIGGDDGFELNKALLVHRRPDLAAAMWNDQPWMHTLLMAKMFSLLGESAAVPRVFSLVCTFLMVTAGWRIMGLETDRAVKWIYALFLLSSPTVIYLGTGAMLELPAFALAMVGVALSCHTTNPRKACLTAYLSGTVMVLAALVKLTALMTVPAWFLLLWLQRKGDGLREFFPRCLAGGIIGFLIGAAVSPTLSLNSLLITHWHARQYSLAEGGREAPWIALFADEPAISLAAGLCIIGMILFKARVFNGILFACTWLLVAVGIHLFHRPWWEYYALHFQIPLAILAAYGTWWVLHRAWEAVALAGRVSGAKPALTSAARSSTDWLVHHPSAAAAAASLILATGFGVRLPAAVKELHRILNTETASDSPYLPLLHQYAGKAEWLFTDDYSAAFLAFHAGILIPPELIVCVPKRIWVGELNTNVILRVLKRYKPDLLFVNRDVDWIWHGVKRAEYLRVFHDHARELWVNQRLDVIPAKEQLTEELTPDEFVKKMGL